MRLCAGAPVALPLGRPCPVPLFHPLHNPGHATGAVLYPRSSLEPVIRRVTIIIVTVFGVERTSNRQVATYVRVKISSSPFVRAQRCASARLSAAGDEKNRVDYYISGRTEYVWRRFRQTICVTDVGFSRDLSPYTSRFPNSTYKNYELPKLRCFCKQHVIQMRRRYFRFYSNVQVDGPKSWSTVKPENTEFALEMRIDRFAERR